MLNEENVLKLAKYLPIRVHSLGDCGFEDINSLSLDNPQKLLS